jgi:hypothetical protein
MFRQLFRIFSGGLQDFRRSPSQIAVTYSDMVQSAGKWSARGPIAWGSMFQQVASGFSEKSARNQATGPIVVTRDSSALRPSRWFRRLVEQIATPAQDQRLGTLRWCDSTERSLLDDSSDGRETSVVNRASPGMR